MSRIVFDCARPVVESDPARNDVACFVGLARATGSALPSAIQDWLQTHGWTDGITSSLAASIGASDTEISLTAPLAVGRFSFVFVDQETMGVDAVDSTGKILSVERGAQGTAIVPHAAGASVQAALSPSSRPIGPPFTDIPIPIESYAAFTALFDPGGSPASFGTDYLATAVRSFFAQGGRRCYVVRMDDPVAPQDDAQQSGTTGKAQKLTKLLPADFYAVDDRRSWHGVGHLGGLPDVSFLAIPDLPVLSASGPTAAAGVVVVPPPGQPQFEECPTLPAPNGSSVSRNAGAGGFVAGRDVYFWTTFVNQQGEGTVGAEATYFNTAANDQLIVSSPSNVPPWALQLPSQSAITGYNLYEADVAHGSPIPAGASSRLVNVSGPVPLEQSIAVNNSATGKVPPSTNGALIVAALPPPPPTYILPAPRLTPDDYTTKWCPNVQAVLSYLLQNNIREIQFVAAFPLPRDVNPAGAAQNPASTVLAQDIHDVITQQMAENIPPGANDPPAVAGLSTAFLQLSYPWLKTGGSSVLNESLEPPDGALVGILARNALTRGAFMDATKIVPSEISDVSPYLPSQESSVPTILTWGDNSWKPLIIRVSLFGFTPAGLRLLSDVTTYPGEAYRPARTHRLVSVISRAARQLGERIVFQQNGPTLWKTIENSLGQLMTQLWRANALDGAQIQDAFSVRCDASTMTQNDLDNGRLIAQVTFTAAATIELIRVTLAIETSGASAQGIAVMAEAG